MSSSAKAWQKRLCRPVAMGMDRGPDRRVVVSVRSRLRRCIVKPPVGEAIASFKAQLFAGAWCGDPRAWQRSGTFTRNAPLIVPRTSRCGAMLSSDAMRLYAIPMQPILQRILGDARGRLAMQFIRFGTVGAAGFVVDTAMVYGLRCLLGLYGAGAAAYLVAATFTWIFNRLWTFRGGSSGGIGRQWALFLAVQSLGFVVNRGVFAVLVTVSPLCATHPVIAVLAGTLAGMFMNFATARRFVFAQK